MSSHSQLDLISDHSKEKLTEVPKEVLEMRNLKMLFLEGNFLYKLPESFFSKLPRLMWLDVRNNQLESIPRGIAYHQCLENLLLTNNNISSLPDELGLVPNLKALQVSENPLIYPSRKIVAEGTKAIKKFLKAQYELCNPIPDIIDSQRNMQSSERESEEKVIFDVSASEEKVDSSKSGYKQEVYNKIIKDLSEKIRDPLSLQPTIRVKKLSSASIKKRSKQPEPVKIVHKITRDGSKISLKSCLNRIGVRGNISKPSKESLREGWLNQMRILLNDQEKLIQQERNLRALTSWRSKAQQKAAEEERPQTPKVFRDTDVSKPTAPYATYPEFARMPSREDLGKQLNVFFKNRETSKRGIQKKLNIEKLIIDLMEQLKEMECTYTGSRSAKAEIEEAGKQIKTIMEIHKQLLQIKSSNDSSLSYNYQKRIK